MKRLKKHWRYIRYNIIFKSQLGFGIWFLNAFFDRKYAKDLKQKLAFCEEGSIGYELLKFHKKNGFDFVAKYEKHDLKHVILGYRARPDDELRMQAFMFGNAGFSILSIGVAAIFIIWTPEMWKDFKTHFKKGRKVSSIGKIRVEEVMNENLVAFRQKIGHIV